MKTMGIWDLFDQMLADTLSVDVSLYIETIEKFNDEDMEYIVETMLNTSSTDEDRQKAKDLFDTKINK
jgi:hypothetical protein